MIKSLTVENFQQQKQARVEFCPGVNVFAGTSDIGKSALIRSLLWVITNRPQGLDFRNWDCKKDDCVTVTIETQKDTITRQRSEIENAYYLNGKKFIAMKSAVPEEIAHAFDMAAVNLQTQYMPHYLLSASSGEVARVLNEACDLSIIDSTTKSINVITSRAVSENKVATAEIEELTHQLSELEWVSSAEILLASVISEANLLEEKQIDLGRLTQLTTQIDDAIIQVADSALCCGIWASLPSIMVEVQQITEIASSIKGTAIILMELDEVMGAKEAIQIKSAEAIQIADDFCAVLIADEKQNSDLITLIRLVSDIDEQVTQVAQILGRLKKELAVAWKETPACPLCGTEIVTDKGAEC